MQLLSKILSLGLFASALTLLLLASPISGAPGHLQHQLSSLSPAQQRDLLQGILIAKAVSKKRQADGLDELTPQQIRDVLHLTANVLKRSNPSGTYAPTVVSECPPAPSDQPGGSTGYIRNASSQMISSAESEYMSRHRTQRQSEWRSWLSASSPLPDLNQSLSIRNYTDTIDNIPRVGLALSGGGYRAMLFGLGVTQGFDGRNSTSSDRGLGGVLQRADYLAGLSGGAWATGTYAMNNFPQAQELVDEVLNLSSDLVQPENGALVYYADVSADVALKRNAGFTTSLTDYWGRALSYHLLNQTMYPNQGQATTWGDIRNVSAFANASYPYPVIIADERMDGELLLYSNTSIFEFSPYDFGTWDRIKAFFPIDILGSTVSNGNVTRCVVGFDNFGWVVGTSSSLFSGALIQALQSEGNSALIAAIESVLGSISAAGNDVSQAPNPFRGYTDLPLASQGNVTLVDGGLDDNNIPLWPLLQPARQLDFIIAVDASADTDYLWPNGSALYQTHIRAQSGEYPEVPVPYFPSPNTFVNRGLNTRPVFFGCNATNSTNARTAADGRLSPIVAYIPNYPWTYLSNSSTYQLSYSPDQAQGILDNSMEVATLGSKNATWSQCLACGMMERTWLRAGVERPSACQDCLDLYCWDGVEDDAEPKAPYSPPVGPPEWVANPQYQGPPPSSGRGPADSAFSLMAADRTTLLTAVVMTVGAMAVATLL